VEEHNRHPADRLADVRQDIKRLEEEEQELRVYLLEHTRSDWDRTHCHHWGAETQSGRYEGLGR
jgi:hypothetical protein